MARKRIDAQRTYFRDGRAPIPESEVTSRTMSAIRGRDTGLELSLRKALWRSGIRGYRVNMKGLPGRPDVVFTKQRLAIFVHGCFWHRCPVCAMHIPKVHSDYWESKFQRNIERDARNRSALEYEGWMVIIFWEHEIKSDLTECVEIIKDALVRRGSQAKGKVPRGLNKQSNSSS